jgi:hypothetical protein
MFRGVDCRVPRNNFSNGATVSFDSEMRSMRAVLHSRTALAIRDPKQLLRASVHRSSIGRNQ